MKHIPWSRRLTRLFTCALCALPTAAQQTPSGLRPGAEAWYLPTEDGQGELFVYEVGRGAPVVVLHGGPGGELTYMLPVSRGLEDDFRFVFYDQRGSLRSRAAPDSVSMANHVADLDALRRALQVERIHLASHSAGTLLAFEYLAAHPERVQNLVLIGALPHKNGPKYFDEEYAELWSTLDEDRRAFDERDAVREALAAAGVDDPVKTPKQRAQLALIRQVGAGMVHVERWRSQIPIRVAPEAAAATRETTSFEYDHGASLASHAFPVTVINGELDYVVGPRGSPLWEILAATTAPELEVVVIWDAGHNVWCDEPAAFQAALGRALRKREH